jgi:hypothetical protein
MLTCTRCGEPITAMPGNVGGQMVCRRCLERASACTCGHAQRRHDKGVHACRGSDACGCRRYVAADGIDDAERVTMTNQVE